ncbi:MAG: copper amine oxidase N-terminal domain-containing protein [Thermacetogeniaceae bacterium]
MRKAVISLMIVLALAILVTLPVPAIAGSSAANSNITSAEFVIGLNQYFVNNQTPGIGMDAAPYIDPDSSRTLIPVRYLGNALGAQTNWDGNTQTVAVTEGSTTISLVIGSASMSVNGQAQTLDQAPVIKDGRTYLPARWVANALGYQVDWNGQYKIVIIWKNGQEPDVSNLAGQKPTTVNGFTIPAGTKLSVDNGDISGGDAMSFDIDTKNGDVQGQLADAQNILSQAKFLDPATIAKVMTVINNDLAGKTIEDGGINSPNGGCIALSAAGPTIQGYWWFNIQAGTTHLPAKYYMLK